MFELIEKLNTAYGMSTPAHNLFARAINSINWETTFQADGETYFVLGDLTLTVENLDPFAQAYKPVVMFGTQMLELGWM